MAQKTKKTKAQLEEEMAFAMARFLYGAYKKKKQREILQKS